MTDENGDSIILPPIHALLSVQAFLIVCPKGSESQATYELLTSISPEAPVILMNPELINAEVVGFGMGKSIRQSLSSLAPDAPLLPPYITYTYSWTSD